MPDIHLLDEQTIDQIAAGEVIERPFSVVKELVENALDAGADTISVELKGGGLDLIRVTDNGCGIKADQIRLAFFRHATSKIDTARDLFSIRSMGFRGEALSSIASVARVELVSRTPDSEAGFRYQIEGGVEKEAEACAAPLGTRISVRDLFFNTPVRRNFLKSAQTETSYVVTLMEQLALSRTGISMRLVTDDKLRFQTGSQYSLKDVIYLIYGRDTAAHMRPVEFESADMQLTGYVGEPSLNRGSRSGQLFFVNGRAVKNAMMMKALEQAYHGLTMQHKFPVGVLRVEMDPAQVDVNVHPQKSEVRFRSEKEVFDLIYRGVRDALFAQDLIPDLEAPQPAVPAESAEKPQQPVPSAAFTEAFIRPQKRMEETVHFPAVPVSQEKSVTPAAPVVSAPAAPPVKEAAPAPRQQNLFEEKILQPEKLGSFRLIGQVFDTYWLMEYEGWFLLADQHAVHEKILYERSMKALASREATSQQLMPPLILTLTGAGQETLRRYEDSFRRLGFEIESLGGREIRIDAVPDNLFSLSSRELFLSMLEELGEERVTAPRMLDEKLALMSCKAAVKGNDPLSFPEAESLLKELLTLENPYTCPHGRPTLVRFSKGELEKMFKRTL